MAALQRPSYVYMGGQITPWDEAHLLGGSEALIRGINVFEGVAVTEEFWALLRGVRSHPAVRLTPV